jgi:hypothetical protein
MLFMFQNAEGQDGQIGSSSRARLRGLENGSKYNITHRRSIRM